MTRILASLLPALICALCATLPARAETEQKGIVLSEAEMALLEKLRDQGLDAVELLD